MVSTISDRRYARASHSCNLHARRFLANSRKSVRAQTYCGLRLKTRDRSRPNESVECEHWHQSKQAKQERTVQRADHPPAPSLQRGNRTVLASLRGEFCGGYVLPTGYVLECGVEGKALIAGTPRQAFPIPRSVSVTGCSSR